VLHLAVILFALPKAVAGEGLSAWLPALGTLLFAYALCAGAFYGYRTLQARSSTEDRTDRFLTHLPLLGKLRRMLALERFSEVFRIYLLSAFKPSEAIAAAGKASQSGHLLMESTLVSEQLVLGKNRLGPLLLANGAFPKDFAAGMSTAEESGTLDKELQRWANHYSTQARDAFSQFEIWLPRLIYVIISAFLTWKIVSWYYGYFDSISSLL
jgi:type IV pilus assembly protein PilC